jgi:predicted dehydrogenase
MTNKNRRQFIKSSLLAGIPFMIVPRRVLGGKGYTAPSDKLNIAAVGIGGIGSRDLSNVENENIIALCDVDDLYAARIFHKYPHAKKYTDFRKMLNQESDIDAVMIATPDHTHAVITMEAIKKNKHVYCQKPLAHDIHETRALTKAAKKAGIVTQMGIQGHAQEGIRLMCEWIWDGAIGPVHKVEAWSNVTHYPPGHTPWSPVCDSRPLHTPPVPGYLDWDLWLGPAQYRPYSPCYHPKIWRTWWAFGSGWIADRGTHTLDPVVTALKLGLPESVEAIVTDFNEEIFPVASIVNYRFPKRENFPELELTWYEGLRPPKPKILEEGRMFGGEQGGVLFIGEKGMLMCGIVANNPRIIPETRMKAYKRPPKTLPRSPGIHQEWLQACKGQGETGAHFDYASRLTEIVLLGNVAKRFNGQILNWDGASGKVTNIAEANQYLRTNYRDGWTL